MPVIVCKYRPGGANRIAFTFLHDCVHGVDTQVSTVPLDALCEKLLLGARERGKALDVATETLLAPEAHRKLDVVVRHPNQTLGVVPALFRVVRVSVEIGPCRLDAETAKSRPALARDGNAPVEIDKSPAR